MKRTGKSTEESVDRSLDDQDHEASETEPKGSDEELKESSRKRRRIIGENNIYKKSGAASPARGATTQEPGSALAQGNFGRVSNERIDTPRYRDVLMGRGRGIQSANGNFLMREYVKTHQERYWGLPRNKRRDYADGVLDEIMKTGARFLKKADDSDVGAMEQWVTVEREIAHEKVSHALRDKASFKTSTSSINQGEQAPHQQRMTPQGLVHAGNIRGTPVFFAAGYGAPRQQSAQPQQLVVPQQPAAAGKQNFGASSQYLQARHQMYHQQQQQQQQQGFPSAPNPSAALQGSLQNQQSTAAPQQPPQQPAFRFPWHNQATNYVGTQQGSTTRMPGRTDGLGVSGGGLQDASWHDQATNYPRTQHQEQGSTARTPGRTDGFGISGGAGGLQDASSLAARLLDLGPPSTSTISAYQQQQLMMQAHQTRMIRQQHMLVQAPGAQSAFGGLQNTEYANSLLQAIMTGQIAGGRNGGGGGPPSRMAARPTPVVSAPTTTTTTSGGDNNNDIVDGDDSDHGSEDEDGL